MIVVGRAVLGLLTAFGVAAVAVGAAAPTPTASPSAARTTGTPMRFEAASVAVPMSAVPMSAVPKVPAEVPPAPRVGTQIVALGDSVLSARRCGCPGALLDYSRLVDSRTHHPALMVNASDGPATSRSVLQQMADWPTLAADLHNADMVVLMVGANDFDDAFDAVTAGKPAAVMYGPVADQLRRNVIAIVHQARLLRGAPIPVQVLGDRNDFRDGQVAQQQYSAAKRSAAAAATVATNDALQAAAGAAGASWVPLKPAFEQHGDPTQYLEQDGNHPDAAGNELIAAALFHSWMATPAARWPAG